MNDVQTDAGRIVIREFESFVAAKVSEIGVWPLPMVVKTKKEAVDYVELQCSDRRAYEIFLQAIRSPDVQAVVFALDRMGSPAEQGTEMEDVLTCILYEKPGLFEIQDGASSFRNRFRFGVLNYCFKPRAVRHVDWSNKYWINGLQNELFRFVPPDNVPAGARLVRVPNLN